MFYFSKIGAPGRTRTADTWIFSPMLYQLSYRSKKSKWWDFKDSNLGPSGYEPDALTNWAKVPKVIIFGYDTILPRFSLGMATQKGLEPSTFAVTGRRSNQTELLSHTKKALFKSPYYNTFCCYTLVGVEGLEPPTPWSQIMCANPTALHPAMCMTLFILHYF